MISCYGLKGHLNRLDVFLDGLVFTEGLSILFDVFADVILVVCLIKHRRSRRFILVAVIRLNIIFKFNVVNEPF